MGEHKTNRRAVVKAMLPAFPAGVDYTNVELRGGFTLRRGVIIVAPESIRKAADGSTEVLWDNGGTKEWGKPPEGTEVIPEGTKLGYEHLEFVVFLLGVRVDQTSAIAGPDGRKHPQATGVQLAELCRVPGNQYLAMFGEKKDAGLIVTG